VIGQTIRNYVIEEKLGQGGMGVVYRARDVKLGRPVALKVLPPELVRDPERRRRFLQEARAAAAVNHPAIAPIYEVEEDGDLTVIVMEYVDGSTLRALVARGELDLAGALEVATQVAEALARAHDAGVVHRDIKSDNIMVTRDGHPKILDFGLAKLLDASGPVDAQGTSQAETMARTHAGMIMGTVSYMSPEQARGLPADRRSDVFSFGVVLYEMVTGSLPFTGASALDTLHAIAYAPTQPVTTLRAGLPYALQKVIDRCLEKSPDQRYQDLRDAAAELRTVKRAVESGVSGGMPLAERVRWWARGLSGRGLAWAGVAGGLLAILVVLTFSSRRVDFGGLLFVLVIGALLFRRFRNRGVREMRRFVKKAAVMKEVRLVSFAEGQFTVVAEAPTAKTYLRLNALLTTANQRLFHGKPMTMVVREDVGPDELRALLQRAGVQYIRDDEAPRK
jgi:tRNA A-37 threonylcarbamoyl transferase component Bud32